MLWAELIAFWSAVRVAAAGPAAVSAASWSWAFLRVVWAWLSCRLAEAVEIGALCCAWASDCWACWIESAAAARSAAERPPLSVASFAFATARFAFAIASVAATELESATARTWPFLTLWPTVAVTDFTSHVLLPPALDELDVLEATSWGWLPNARP